MMNRKALPLILIIIASLGVGFAYAEPRYTPLNIYEYYDDSITSHMVFDEANYIYVTPYGNYTFLQPGNILRFTDYRGQEIITQSVFVTQYDNFGNWLPLLDFYDRAGGDPAVIEANDTYYEWQYTVYDKKTPIAVGKLSFTVDPNPEIRPKISTEITPNENWPVEGFTDFRWIWDLVPFVNDTTGVGYTFYRNQTSGETTDISEFKDLRELYTSQPDVNDTATYEELNRQSRVRITDNFTKAVGILDVSSYNATTWYGGQEPNWNSKGFVTIFPVNEAVIDPIAYTESAPELIDMTGWSSGWSVDEDVGSAPANSVAEIIAVNPEASAVRTLGVRGTDQSTARYLTLNEAEDGGGTATRFLVNVDSSGNADFYRTISGNFYLVGFWEDVTFYEDWTTYSVTSAEDDTWHETDGTELNLTANRAHLITISHDDAGKNQVAGVRNTTSSLTRSVDIMEAEGGGVQTVSMFVQADAAAKIDVYTAQYDDHTFINQGYFDDTVNFTEDFQSNTIGISYETWDLFTAYDVPKGSIVDYLALHQDESAEEREGARENGTVLARFIYIREAEGGGNSGHGLSVPTDSNGVIQGFSGTTGGSIHYYTGYFVFEAGGITEYQRGVTQAVSVASAVTRVMYVSRGVDQGVGVASAVVRVYGAKRGTSQGISMATAVTRLYGATRNPTQGIAVASAVSRAFGAIRGVSQSITSGSAVTRIFGAIRGVTQSVTAGSVVSKLFTSVRGLTQSINVAGSVTRTFNAIRGTTQSITASSAVSRVFTGLRGLTQGITTSTAVTRIYMIIRGLTQSVTLTSSVGREYVGSRGLTQSVSVANAVSRGFDAIRGVTQGLTIDNAVSRIYGAKRGVAQTINMASAVTRIYTQSLNDFFRGLTQSIDIGSGVTRVYGSIRGLSQSITTSSAVSRIYTIIRGLTQSITVGSDTTRIYNGVRGVTQSVTVGSGISRIFAAIRGVSQSITVDNAVSRVYTIIRGLTQSITVGGEANRVYQAIRGLTQSLTVDNAVSRIYNGVRGLTQGITTGSAVTRLRSIIRGLIQGITVEGSTSRLYKALRNPTQSITVASDLARILTSGINNFVRGLSQSITVNSAVSRMGIFMRGVSQNVDITTFLNYPGDVLTGSSGFLQLLPIIVLIFAAVTYYNMRR